MRSMVSSNTPSTKLHAKAVLVNVILVVGHEKLNVEMQRTFGNSLTVLKVPKSGGVRPGFSTSAIHSQFPNK